MVTLAPLLPQHTNTHPTPDPTRQNAKQNTKMTSSCTIAAVLTVALVLAATGPAAGQSDCASKLIPCAQFLGSTNPSSECCNAMREVVTTQLSCLCGLLNNPSALGPLNITQALELPRYCNISSDTSACNATAPTSSIRPPAVPGGNNAAVGVSWMGMPVLLLASALTFFY